MLGFSTVRKARKEGEQDVRGQSGGKLYNVGIGAVAATCSWRKSRSERGEVGFILEVQIGTRAGIVVEELCR